MKHTMTLKKNIKEDIGVVNALYFTKKIIDCTEYNNSTWVENNATGEIVNLAQIKICRDVLQWIAESGDFNFYEDFK